jgi:hypothetical protein
VQRRGALIFFAALEETELISMGAHSSSETLCATQSAVQIMSNLDKLLHNAKQYQKRFDTPLSLGAKQSHAWIFA